MGGRHLEGMIEFDDRAGRLRCLTMLQLRYCVYVCLCRTQPMVGAPKKRQSATTPVRESRGLRRCKTQAIDAEASSEECCYGVTEIDPGAHLDAGGGGALLTPLQGSTREAAVPVLPNAEFGVSRPINLQRTTQRLMMSFRSTWPTQSMRCSAKRPQTVKGISISFHFFCLGLVYFSTPPDNHTQ